jgi:PAS domain-containing protein
MTNQSDTHSKLAYDYVSAFDCLGVPAIATDREGRVLAFNSLFTSMTGFSDALLQAGPTFSVSMVIDDRAAAEYLLADIASIKTAGAFLGHAIITVETTFGASVQTKVTLTPFGLESDVIVVVVSFRRTTFWQGVIRGGANFRQFLVRKAHLIGYILALVVTARSFFPMIPEPPTLEDILPPEGITNEAHDYP